MDILNKEELFESLFKRYGQKIWNYFRGRGLSHADCDDLTQETFIAAYRSFTRDPDRELSFAWLLKISGHIFINWSNHNLASKRSIKKTVAASAIPEKSNGFFDQIQSNDHKSNPHHKLEIRDQLMHLTDLLNRLPSKMRHCYKMRQFQGRSFEEIGIVLKISESTARSQCSLARKRLEPEMRKKFGDWSGK